MIFKTGLAALAVLSLSAAPAMAAQSVAAAPATEQVGSTDASSLGGGNGFAAIALGGVILAAFVLAILDATDDDDGNGDVPVSP